MKCPYTRLEQLLTQDADVKGHYLGGGDISSVTALPAAPDRPLLCTIRNNILSWSIRDGALTHVQPTSYTYIIGIAGNPCNTAQLLMATRSGDLVVWDMTDWSVMNTFQITTTGRVIRLLVSNSKTSFFAVTEERVNDGYATHIKKVQLEGISHVQNLQQSSILVIKKECDEFRVSPCGNWILYLRDKRVRVINTKTCATFTRYTHDRDLVTATIHPNLNIAAVGDCQGRIITLHDWNVKGSTVSEVNHWHANPVITLCFAPRSEALFSGGKESVLVKWLEGQPQFLPRIGSAIKWVLIPGKGDMVAVVTDANVIHTVSLNTWSVRHRLSHVLRPSPHASESMLALNGSDNVVLLPSTSGHIQMFDFKKRNHVGVMDVTKQNLTTGRYISKPLSYLEIMHFQVSVSGDWLVTVERRSDGFVTPECRLKFWRRCPDNKEYTLHTCIESPHTKIVTSLGVGVTAGGVLTAVTTSTDTFVKVWQRSSLLEVKEEEEEDGREGDPIELGDKEKDNMWDVSRTLTYASEPAYSSIISEDGTVLVVAFKGVAVLYTCSDYAVKAVLPLAVNRTSALFLAGHDLITSAKDLITVWDLRSLSQRWEATSNVSHILKLSETLFIAFVKRKSFTDAYVFRPDSPVPVKVHKMLCPGVVTGACLVNGDIIVRTGINEIHIISSIPPPPIALSFMEETSPISTVFSELLKISAPPTVQKVDVMGVLDTSNAHAILSCPSSVLPPVSSICSNILSDFLPKKS